MPRLWILLLVVWYRAITIAKTENSEVSLDQNISNGFTINPNEKKVDSKQEINFPSGDDITKFGLEENLWDYLNQQDPNIKPALPETENNIKIKNPEDINNRENKHTTLDVLNSISDKRLNERDEFLSNVIPDHKVYTENDIAEAARAWNGDSFEDTPIKDAMINFVIDNCLPEAKAQKIFKPWGGKRLDSELPSHSDIIETCMEFLQNLFQENNWNADVQNQPTFSAWGGKRNDVDDSAASRLPFRAWGGKRDTIDTPKPKSQPFRSWGGKRNPETVEYPGFSIPDNRLLDNLANLFQDENNARINQKRLKNKKTNKFHSWGGKRNVQEKNTDLDFEMYPFEAILNEPEPHINNNQDSDMGIDSFKSKRPKFNSWGGKRFAPEGLEYPEAGSGSKRNFNAWGGKRAFVTRAFNAWGGKRTPMKNYDYNTAKGFKRNFNAWGGK